MNIFRRRKILKSTNALDLIPVRTADHTLEDGKVILLTPKFTWRLLHALFPVTKTMFFRIKLDENGTRVWNEIDGNRTTAEIADIIATPDQGNKDQAEAQGRLTRFMELLYEREYISFRQIM